jgi:microcystin-dependent protein
MKKTLLSLLFLILVLSTKAQFGLIANTVNTIDSTFSLYQQGSPSNVYGNRLEYFNVSKNRIKIYSGKVYLDSSRFITSNGQITGKILWVDGTGLVKASIKDSLTIAYSQLSNPPTINSVLSGQIIMYGGSSAPTGYLLCDGSAVSRTTYVNLYTITSTTFGSGDGSTTFNLPDLRQRFALGKSVSGTGSTLGSTGGNIDHIHTVDPPNTTSTGPSATVAATILVGGAASTTHTHDVNISVFNSGVANPPFQVVNYIIKY